MQTERHHQAFLEEGRLERGDGAVDELGAVVDRHHLGALGQRRGDLVEALLDVVDDGQRVGAVALQGNAARHLAFAVELGNAAPLVRADLDARDVLKQHRRAAVHFDDDLLEVCGASEIAAAAHHELVLGQLERAAADVHVAVADDVAHLLQRNAEGTHAAGIDDDAVLLDEAADAGNLGDALGLGQAEADFPVLQRAQVGERFVLAHHRVLIDPADAAGVRSEGRGHAGGQPLGCGVEVFKDTAARPVDVGAVLEDDVDERHAEERKATHDLRARHGKHRSGQRIGDLIFDHLRSLARKLGVDDDLRVREIGDGVERQVGDAPTPRDDREGGGDEHQHQVARRPANKTRDHWCVSLAAALSGL